MIILSTPHIKQHNDYEFVDCFALLASSQMVTPSQVHSVLEFWKSPADLATTPPSTL